MQGRARGRKGERKTYHVTIFELIIDLAIIPLVEDILHHLGRLNPVNTTYQLVQGFSHQQSLRPVFNVTHPKSDMLQQSNNKNYQHS